MQPKLRRKELDKSGIKKKIAGSIFGNNPMNYLREYDLSVDIILIVYMLCVNFFFKGRSEKIVKDRHTQRGITYK